MIKPEQITRVCVVDSAYSLLLYFLISTEEEINHTFYFWSKGIPEQVKSYFKDQSFSNDRVFKNRFQLYWYQIKLYHYQAIRIWPFLKNKNITYWGHDHLFFSAGIIRNNNINVIEDGVRNYYPISYGKKFKFLRKLLFGPLGYLPFFAGSEDECKTIYLTGLKNTSIMHNPKVKKISISELWIMSPQSKKNKILSIFNLTSKEIELLKSKNEILITQPLSEDGIITEKEKVALYNDILKNSDLSKLIIKPHPRERTKYSTYFTQVPVFNKKIPLQLLSLCGIKFKKAYTICSTAAFDFPYQLEIIYIGSQIHPEIYKVLPDLSIDNYNRHNNI